MHRIHMCTRARSELRTHINASIHGLVSVSASSARHGPRMRSPEPRRMRSPEQATSDWHMHMWVHNCMLRQAAASKGLWRVCGKGEGGWGEEKGLPAR